MSVVLEIFSKPMDLTQKTECRKVSTDFGKSIPSGKQLIGSSLLFQHYNAEVQPPQSLDLNIFEAHHYDRGLNKRQPTSKDGLLVSFKKPGELLKEMTRKPALQSSGCVKI